MHGLVGAALSKTSEPIGAGQSSFMSPVTTKIMAVINIPAIMFQPALSKLILNSPQKTIMPINIGI
jgi:hypothetical protein